MRTPVTVRERLRIARGRLHEYEGHLRRVEGRLTVLRGRAEQARGQTRLRLLRVERRARGTLDTTLKRIDEMTEALAPRIRRAVDRAEALGRRVAAGVTAGARTYRRSRRT